MRFLSVMSVAVLCLGFVPLFEKQAVARGAGLFPLTVTINLVTVAVLAPAAWRQRPARLSDDWRSLLVIGALASGIVVLLNLWALETTSATHRSVFQAMYPAAGVLFALVILGERLPVKGYATIAAMVVGILMLSGQGFRWQFAFGDMLLFATVPMMGFCDAWAKRSLAGLSAEWVALGRFVFGTVLLLVAGTVGQAWQGWPTGNGWWWVLLSGLSIGLGVLMLYRGMALKGAALAAALVSLSPVITAVLEWWWLQKTFSHWELAGMAMVITGGVLLSRPRFQTLKEHESPVR